jgi:outer membrane protein assembly factor BamA
MRLSLMLCALLLPCLSIATPAQHQAQHSAEYTIHRLVFQGDTSYSQSALEAVSGLHPGSSLKQSGLQAAADRLIGTGAFSDVQASFDGPLKSVDVIFKIQATTPSNLLYTSFENFVWWQPAELTSELQKRVPLFNGSIPEGGNQQDAIQEALRQLLAAKGITATVSSELIAPYPSQPLRIAEYRVEPPLVVVHSLNLSGVSPSFSPLTERLAATLIGTQYNEGLTTSSIKSRILDIYRDAGYQEASLTSLTRTVDPSPSSNVNVDVAATIHEGEPYHLNKLDWFGSPVMSAQAFAAQASLHPGDLATQQRLRDSLANLDAAYRNHGYVDVIVTATPSLNPATHQATFTVSAVPGPQYRLRNLTVLNLTPAQKKEFDSIWKLRPNDIYDAAYVSSFLQDKSALISLPEHSTSFKLVEDPEASLLDLSITFNSAAITAIQ